MVNFIASAVIVIAVGSALWYILKEKKKGTRCIGCPSGGSCGKKCCCETKK